MNQPNGDQPPAPAPMFSAYYPRTPSHPSSSGSLKGWCCCLFLLLSFLALLALAVVLVIILSVNPKEPQFDLLSVGVQYMNIVADSPTGTTLTIRLVFEAVNPNKVRIKYGESRFTILSSFL